MWVVAQKRRFKNNYYPLTTHKSDEYACGINVERMTTNQKAEGSSPPGRAKRKLLKPLMFQGFFIFTVLDTLL